MDPREQHSELPDCPTWCKRPFCDKSRPPGDRMHRSRLEEFEVDVLRRELDPFGDGVLSFSEPETFNVHAACYPDEDRTWVAIVTDESPAILTVESAVTLRDALSRIIQLVESK